MCFLALFCDLADYVPKILHSRALVTVLLARVVGIPVCQRSGGRLASTLVATINIIIFSRRFFPSVVYFFHRGSVQIKVLILQKLTGAPKNLGLDTFPDPVSHFGAP